MEKSYKIIKLGFFLAAIFYIIPFRAQLNDSGNSKIAIQLSSTLNFSNNDLGFNFSNPIKSGLHFQIVGTLKNKSIFYFSLTRINQYRNERPTGNFELISSNAHSISAGYQVLKYNKKDFNFNFFAGIETRLGNEEYALFPTTIWFQPANIATRTCADIGVSVTPHIQYKISNRLKLNLFLRQSYFAFLNKNNVQTELTPSSMNTSVGFGVSYSIF